jgi:carboxymethylenebutenolidase
MQASWETVTVDNSPMKLYLCQPDGAGPFPAVVVIQNQDGVGEFTQEMTRRIAEAGYIGIAPDLYHRNTLEINSDHQKRAASRQDSAVIKDVNASVDFLRDCATADAGRLGVVGFCMGGRVAFLSAAVNPMFRAAVDFYGGGVYKAWGGGPTPAERAVEIHCPIQGHFGELDKNPPADEMRKLDAELKRLGKPHEFYFYPDAGHAFNRKGWEGYRPEADAASWPRTLDFLSSILLTPSRRRLPLRGESGNAHDV